MFEPDYRHILAAARNRKPERLPLYEHNVSEKIMAKALNREVTLQGNCSADYKRYYSDVCEFWRTMTYDTVSYEAPICAIMPGTGAILGGKAGPIQNRADFDSYPFDAIPGLFWKKWEADFKALAECMPDGMKAVGGCGYGVFEISEDLVGYEYLCLLQYDDPDLFRDLYIKIGDMMMEIWSRLLENFDDTFVVCRMGDDLGFKSSTLLAPEVIIEHVIPQYRRIIQLAHDADKPFLLHSCGNIFDVMESLIEAGIDAKHSNEDQIAPYTEWIERYGQRIGLFGGIDVDILCQRSPEDVYEYVLKNGRRFSSAASGFALGSGNSIPEYVPLDGYLAMIRAVQDIRSDE